MYQNSLHNIMIDNLITDTKNFYPTPPHIIEKMCEKVSWGRVNTILDPSAGRGDILKRIISRGNRYSINAIEIDENLQAILRKDSIPVIDSDFLMYAGGDQFDLIIMNPPFDEGDKHLLKAIEIMFSGEIVCILNAETIRNPYSNIRKELATKLKNLNANIEFISNAFSNAERKTDVDIALIHIDIKNDIKNTWLDDTDLDVMDNDIIDGLNSTSNAVSHRNNIKHLVAEYNHIKQTGIDVLMNYYKHRDVLKDLINIETNIRHRRTDNTETNIVKDSVNDFIIKLRKKYWKKTMDIPEIYQKMTQRKTQEFFAELENRSMMEFTERNVYAFAKNVCGNYVDTISEAIIDLFDEMTRKYSYWSESENNILHFNSWKTNDAFKVNKKVIIPYMEMLDYAGNFSRVPYNKVGKLDDIDKVMNYFAGYDKYLSIVDALNGAFDRGHTRRIRSTFFEISVFKKGTIHLTFKDMDVYRRFNVFCCKNKGFLPEYYSRKQYKDMSPEDKNLVKEFDGSPKDYMTYGETELKISNDGVLQLEYNSKTA